MKRTLQKFVELTEKQINFAKSGICQKRQPGSGANLNSLFITLRTSSMERIPLQMGILNLLHEILHAFGASHDPKGNISF